MAKKFCAISRKFALNLTTWLTIASHSSSFSYLLTSNDSVTLPLRLFKFNALLNGLCLSDYVVVNV